MHKMIELQLPQYIMETLSGLLLAAGQGIWSSCCAKCPNLGEGVLGGIEK